MDQGLEMAALVKRGTGISPKQIEQLLMVLYQWLQENILTRYYLLLSFTALPFLPGIQHPYRTRYVSGHSGGKAL